MKKIELSLPEYELLCGSISRARAVIGLLWASAGNNVSPEIQGDALDSAYADCSSAVMILSKLNS